MLKFRNKKDCDMSKKNLVGSCNIKFKMSTVYFKICFCDILFYFIINLFKYAYVTLINDIKNTNNKT